MRVVVADDQREVRSAVRLVVEQQDDMTLVGEFAHLADLEAHAAALEPDVVLLDWELDGLPGPSLVRRCRSSCPTARVIALSGRVPTAAGVLAAGADAFVGKHDPPEQFLRTLRMLEQRHQDVAAGALADGRRVPEPQKEDPCA